MHWMHPEWLWGLAGLPLIWWLAWRGRRRQTRALAEFALPALHPLLLAGPGRARGQGLRLVLWSLAWLLLIAALARPQGAPLEVEQPERLRSLYLVLDVSLSMRVQDAPPSRLEAAKQAAEALIRDHPEDRIGLVVFAREARTLCPATTDHAALRRMLAEVNASLPLAPGSNPAAGLAAARKLLANRPGKAKAAVLLTDGEATQAGDLISEGRRLAAAGVQLLVLGFGTLEGGPIPMGRDFWGRPQVRVYHGKQVTSRLVSLALRRAAAVNGGRYATWESAGKTLPQIQRALRQRQRDQLHSAKVRRYYEFFPWLVALALGLLWWEWRAAYVPAARNDRAPTLESTRPAVEVVR